MKLLFDQNISFRVLKKLDKIFLGSGQVKDLGLQDFSDRQFGIMLKKIISLS